LITPYTPGEIPPESGTVEALEEAGFAEVLLAQLPQPRSNVAVMTISLAQCAQVVQEVERLVIVAGPLG
jgi:hypothetical protein